MSRPLGRGRSLRGFGAEEDREHKSTRSATPRIETHSTFVDPSTARFSWSRSIEGESTKPLTDDGAAKTRRWTNRSRTQTRPAAAGTRTIRRSGRSALWVRGYSRQAEARTMRAAPASDRVRAAVRTDDRLEQAQAPSFGAGSATRGPLTAFLAQTGLHLARGPLSERRSTANRRGVQAPILAALRVAIGVTDYFR